MKSVWLSFILFAALSLLISTSSRAQNKYPLIYEENFDSGSTNWSPNIPQNWQDGSDEQGNFYELLQAGPFGTPRRPTSTSILTPYNVGNFELEVVAKSNTDLATIFRDICLIYGYQDSVRFYYTHFSARSDSKHNITAIVDNADRVKINLEAPGSTKALLTDYEYHTLKVVRSVDSGSIEAFFDDERIMTAKDNTFLYGKIGVGSFDDVATFKSVKLWGEMIVTGVDQMLTLPGTFSLEQNYPNPFNPATNIEFEMFKFGRVALTVFDINGKLIQELVDTSMPIGRHRVIFDGSKLSSGVYYYKVHSGNSVKIKKMLLVK